MHGLVFWMTLVLALVLFSIQMFKIASSRLSDGKFPITTLNMVQVFLTICVIILLLVGKNNFKAENLDASGRGTTTVEQKDLDELAKKRIDKELVEKKKEEVESKKNDEKMLEDMENFKKNIMNRMKEEGQ